jgi:ATP-binding cassette subfamily B protein/subfamily B ATP-binding cassette protein MsbA
MACSVGCGLLFAGANLLPPLLIRRLIQGLTEDSDTRTELLSISIGLFLIYLVRGATRYGYGWFSHQTAYNVLHDLMIRVYRHLQRLPHRFFTDQRTGSLISRSINDIESVEDFVAHGIPETALAAIIPISMIVVLFNINSDLALITLVPIPIAAFLVYRFVSKVRAMWRSARDRLSDLVALVHDNLSGIPVIKSFVQEEPRAALVTGRSAAYRDSLLSANNVSLLPAGIIEAAGGLGVVLVIWSGGHMAFEGRISVADLFVFIVYLGHIYQPFLQLASINDVLQKAAASTTRVFELLSIEPEIVDSPDAKSPDRTEWKITFDHVSFSYDLGIPVLKNISFEVEPGNVVALVGPTGAGKTTVSSLIPRFYDVGEGAIRIGGHDVRDLQLDFLRQNIASVLQDVFLFHGSVRDNILFGRPDATEEELVEAARAANAEEFIRDLPGGYDSVIGERGVRLSGGQKQRLSIARAILKDAPILILDEATSSVDAETESLIQEAIQNLTHNRTTVVIAHRLSTIRNADRIIVIDNGSIAESGSHDHLMHEDGLYARMVNSQDLSRSWRIARSEEKAVD